MQPIVKARGMVRRFGRVTTLNGCNFDFCPGETLAVIGNNIPLGREIRLPGIIGQWFRRLDRRAMEKFACEKLIELALMTGAMEPPAKLVGEVTH